MPTKYERFPVHRRVNADGTIKSNLHPRQRCCASKHFHLDLVPAPNAYLLYGASSTSAILTLVIHDKLVRMRLVLVPLMQIIPRSLSQPAVVRRPPTWHIDIHSLSKTLLKLFLALPLLVIFPPLVLFIKPLFSSPLFPRNGFHLFAHEQHHIAVVACMRVRPQQMR